MSANLNHKKIIYITGLSYSGSTALSYLLSINPKSMALGEIHSIVNKKQSTIQGTGDVCSCGLKMSECSFWSTYNPKVGSPDPKTEYPTIIRMAKSDIIIDSSKRLDNLLKTQKLAAENGFKVYPVLIIRDARGWALSKHRIDKIKGKSESIFRYFIFWLKTHLYMKKEIKKNFGDYIEVGYSFMCENQDEVYRAIYKFIGEKSIFDPSQKMNHHIAHSNRMKKNFSRLSDLKRDTKWKSNYKVRFWLLLLFPIWLWNRKHAHSLHLF